MMLSIRPCPPGLSKTSKEIWLEVYGVPMTEYV
jgi:hypothetical protein